MSRTLYFGSKDLRLASRIDRHIIRRHTPAGYDRLMDLAAQDFARHVAAEVSPGRHHVFMPRVTFAATAPRFGKR
jgi:hypothetical protein